MQGRVYSIPFSGVASAVQVDFFEVVMAATRLGKVLELHLSQSSKVGDAQEEDLLVHIKSGQTTSGSGGSAVTPTPRELGSPAFAGTAETMNTTKASGGTIVTHESVNWNIRVPLERIFSPEVPVVIPPSGRLTVELAKTPNSSTSFAGFLIVQEFG